MGLSKCLLIHGCFQASSTLYLTLYAMLNRFSIKLIQFSLAQSYSNVVLTLTLLRLRKDPIKSDKTRKLMNK